LIGGGEELVGRVAPVPAACCCFQESVAGGVVVLVVELLKAVKVKRDQAEWRAGECGIGENGVQVFLKKRLIT